MSYTLCMLALNHALWGATIGRTVGMPLEGALMGALPDLLSIPQLGWSKYIHRRNATNYPLWMRRIYIVLHNWWFGALLSLGCFTISFRLGVISLAYFWHIFEDAFVHITFATRFLYPVWKGMIRKISAQNSHWWIQFIDLAAIIGVNLWLNQLLKH